MKVKEIYQIIDEFAPFSTQVDFDNCGLLVGDPEMEVEKIGFALDITNEMVDAAQREGVQLIISHHPVIFHGMKQVTAQHPVYRLIRAGISAIACHTNLDKAEGGVNSVLAGYYHLKNIASPLCMEDLGRTGELEQPLPVKEYALQIKQSVGAQAVRYYDSGRLCKHVAYVSGSGGSWYRQALECGCDTLVTGDIKHDQFVDAQNLGINLIEVNHFDSENTVMKPLAKLLAEKTGLETTVLSLENRVQAI